MLKLLPVIASLAFASSALAQGLSREDAGYIVTPTEEVVRLYEEADDGCRGGLGNQAETFADCAAREVYASILEARGVALPQ